MLVETKDKKQVQIRRLNSTDLDNLLRYFENLSPETKKRFGPHPFDKQSVIQFYDNTDLHHGYVAQTIDTLEIIAYSVIRFGYLESDYARFLSYGITSDENRVCEFAPSVADAWQSLGIGNLLFQVILTDLKQKEIGRIVLWGGVQADNEKAVNYYKKNNFKSAGQFTHNGENLDMYLDI